MVEEEEEGVERFFWIKTTMSGSSGSSGRGNKYQSHSPPLLLISGPPSSGKTSLLFQYAYNEAEAAVPLEFDNQHNSPPQPVVFVCNRHRLQTNPPYLSQGVDPSSHVFQLIQMKYVDNIEGLNNYFAAFHLHDTFPLSVIIDDFGHFFHDRYCLDTYDNSRERDLAIVKTLALCHNAIAHANKTGPCKLLLSDTHQGDLPRLLYIYKRWMSSIYTIKGDGSRSFLLKRAIQKGSPNTELDRMKTARYSIALQYLVLEGISEDRDQ